MTEIMIASDASITDGQIENAVNKLRDAIRKHRSEISSDIAQQVLGVENLGMLMFAPFRERAEAVSGMIVRRAKVDRSRPPVEAMKATGRNQYVNEDAASSMPPGEGDEVDVYFFNVGRDLSDPDLDKEFELRGLKPDAYAQAQVNTDDPEFADEKPNGTHWKDGNGKWCYAIFDRWRGERFVCVNRGGYDWVVSWWFAGVRK